MRGSVARLGLGAAHFGSTPSTVTIALTVNTPPLRR